MSQQAFATRTRLAANTRVCVTETMLVFTGELQSLIVDASPWIFYRIIEASQDELDILQKLGLHTRYVDADA